MISEKHSTLLQEGERFGKWTILKKDNERTGDGARYICQCDCGTIRSVKANSLISGASKSCGCLLSKGELLISQLLEKTQYSVKTQYSFCDLKGDKDFLRFDFAIFYDNSLICLIEF